MIISQGYKCTKSFIATQGPVPDSVPDFWRLIWEQNIQIIVMVTNLEERGRVRSQKSSHNSELKDIIITSQFLSQTSHIFFDPQVTA